jgi:hypothetical protein
VPASGLAPIGASPLSVSGSSSARRQVVLRLAFSFVGRSPRPDGASPRREHGGAPPRFHTSPSASGRPARRFAATATCHLADTRRILPETLLTSTKVLLHSREPSRPRINRQWGLSRGTRGGAPRLPPGTTPGSALLCLARSETCSRSVLLQPGSGGEGSTGCQTRERQWVVRGHSTSSAHWRPTRASNRRGAIAPVISREVALHSIPVIETTRRAIVPRNTISPILEAWKETRSFRCPRSISVWLRHAG